MDDIKKAKTVENALEEIYPLAVCSLTAKNAFELLVATRLSAQCTDARVNIVTPTLFEAFGTPQKWQTQGKKMSRI